MQASAPANDQVEQLLRTIRAEIVAAVAKRANWKLTVNGSPGKDVTVFMDTHVDLPALDGVADRK